MTVVEKPDYVWEAERDKYVAEADAARADARLKNAQALDTELESEKTRAQVEKVLREYGKEMCSDEHHCVYQFHGSVGESSVEKCINQLRIWMRQDQDAPLKRDITIWFNSPGGAVIDGMALFDYIQMVRRAGHHVTTGAIGYAASMGGILLQAGDHRVMTEESYIMLHEIAAGAMGKIGEIEDTVAFLEMIMKRVVKIFAERSGMSEARVKKGMTRKDWWIDSTQALKLGLVDQVI